MPHNYLHALFEKSILRSIFSLITNLLLLTLFAAYLYFSLSRTYYWADFRAFYAAALIFREAPTQLYTIDTQNIYQAQMLTNSTSHIELLPFVNPPFLLLLYVPLTLFPPQIAFEILVITLAALLAGNIIVLLNVFRVRKNRLLLFLLALSFAPVFMVLFLGQNSTLGLAIFTAVFILFKKHKYFWAGAVASLLLYKIQLAPILFGYIFLMKDKNALKGLVLGVALILGINLLLLQGNIASFLHYNFWYAFVFDAQASNAVYSTNIETLLWGVAHIAPYFPVRATTLVLSTIFMFITLKAVRRIQPQSTSFPFVFAFMVLATVYTSVHIQLHDAILLILPLIYFWNAYSSKLARSFLLLCWFATLHGVFSTVPVPITSIIASATIASAYFILLSKTRRLVRINTTQ